MSINLIEGAGIGYQTPPADAPEFLKEYLVERNRAVAVELGAKRNGLPPYAQPLTEQTEINKKLMADGYVFLITPQVREQLPEDLQDEEARYLVHGAIVDDPMHLDKAALRYPILAGYEPHSSKYSGELARILKQEGLILPGYAAYSNEDAIQAFRKLASEYHPEDYGGVPFGIRVKGLNSSDGQNQHTVYSSQEAADYFRGLKKANIPGAVLELAVPFEPGEFPLNVSTGIYIDLQGRPYVTMSVQRDAARQGKPDEAIYLGADVIVIPGTLEEVAQKFALGQLDNLPDYFPDMRNAFETGSRLLHLIQEYYPISASRLTVDCLYHPGTDRYYGTDLLGRVCGTDSALPPILADMDSLKREYRDVLDISYGTGTVQLIYGKDNLVDELRPGEQLFVNYRDPNAGQLGHMDRSLQIIAKCRSIETI